MEEGGPGGLRDARLRAVYHRSRVWKQAVVEGLRGLLRTRGCFRRGSHRQVLSPCGRTVDHKTIKCFHQLLMKPLCAQQTMRLWRLRSLLTSSDEG